jgi:hypothetical protein
MKTILVTLTKPGAQAVCELRYHYTHAPASRTWTGNHRAFDFDDGERMFFCSCLTNLELEVAHKAALVNAAYTIQDAGGEAIHADR